ncbi:MAG: family 16 glycosylhydrolase [Thermoguttaceae bacterium]|jgi:hypothetical protein|nr:family 16 glycosylhydrolase [Thermoguttaceae bacterium]
MKQQLLSCALVVCMASPAWGLTPVMVQDFEQASLQPTVWSVNIPAPTPSVQLSTDEPHDGKQCLRLHYRFLGTGGFQYLGIPNKLKINARVHKVRFWLKGDRSRCSYGLQVTDAGGETHQYRSLSNATGQGGVVDFVGWKEVVFDLDPPHETWGGDRNGKLDHPITAIIMTVGQPMEKADGKERLLAAEGDLYFDSLSVDSEKDAEETLGTAQVSVVSPEYCSEVKGDTTVILAAPAFRNTAVTVKCWRQGPGFGSDSTVAAVTLDSKGSGSFVFPADRYPHGPLTLRIGGVRGETKDNCCLQLYNKGGVSWNEGMPKEPPPAAQGMKLVFADDFSGPLSISASDPKATYYSHKPPHGSTDFSVHAFSDFESPKNPFAQVDTYLRIRASDRAKSSGLICSIKNDGSGITAKAPCYFECRFIGPNAPGTWPAFWLMTNYMLGWKGGKCPPNDELDIIEAYGGEGPGHPNFGFGYQVAPHAWEQPGVEKAIAEPAFRKHFPIRMSRLGIPSTWYETFHTYGCKITETDTIYYCDNIEVARHETMPLSKKEPLFFLINLATGGGWPVDLSRYHGVADMYVDYVRVYAGDRR